MYEKAPKVIKGFVVKREWFEEDPTSKRMVKHRKEIGRIYHSKEAAQTLMGMLVKEHPDWTLYVHEKTGQDGLTHAMTS